MLNEDTAQRPSYSATLTQAHPPCNATHINPLSHTHPHTSTLQCHTHQPTQPHSSTHIHPAMPPTLPRTGSLRSPSPPCNLPTKPPTKPPTPSQTARAFLPTPAMPRTSSLQCHPTGVGMRPSQPLGDERVALAAAFCL